MGRQREFYGKKTLAVGGRGVNKWLGLIIYPRRGGLVNGNPFVVTCLRITLKWLKSFWGKHIS